MKLTFILAVVSVVGAASAAIAKDEFFISHWCGPQVSEERFKEAAEDGFTAILYGGSPKALDWCQKLGVKAFVGDGRFGTKENDPDFTSNLDGIIADYSHHPALWGYLVSDEPFKRDFKHLAAVVNYMRERDPNHIHFINLNPSWATPETLGFPDYETYIEEFIKQVNPQMLSFDHYPILREPQEIASNPELTRRQKFYFQNFEIIRRAGRKHNLPFNTIVLTTPHAHYRELTEADIQWQVNVALAYGSRGIMYFTYTTPGRAEDTYHNGIIDEKGQRSVKYEWIKRLNQSLQAMAPTLMRLTSTAVYHTAPLPFGTKPLPEDGLIQSIGSGELIVGQFTSEDGMRYAMFVNRSPKKGAVAKIAFSQKVRLFEVSSMSGREKPIAVAENGPGSAWNVELAPGQAHLVRIQTAENLAVRSWEDR